ncbi:MAG: hypothetical protein KKI02_05870, partial [Planctomycetes bacterium]|nr:hypothetical protein [Planctomycetota bacterium]
SNARQSSLADRRRQARRSISSSLRLSPACAAARGDVMRHSRHDDPANTRHLARMTERPELVNILR